MTEHVLDEVVELDARIAELEAAARAVTDRCVTHTGAGLTFCWLCDGCLDRGGHADDCSVGALAALLVGDA